MKENDIAFFKIEVNPFGDDGPVLRQIFSKTGILIELLRSQRHLMGARDELQKTIFQVLISQAQPDT